MIGTKIRLTREEIFVRKFCATPPRSGAVSRFRRTSLFFIEALYDQGCSRKRGGVMTPLTLWRQWALRCNQ